MVTRGLVDPASNPTSPNDIYVVRGQVRQADGTVLAGVAVEAVGRDLRSEQSLGQTTTDPFGRYEIRYTAEQFQRAEKGSADLIVRVFDGRGIILVASPLRFNVSIDLMVGGQYEGSSQYEDLVSDVVPLLVDMSLVDITEDSVHQDVTFLAGETGQDRMRIAFLASSSRLAEQTGLPTPAFYAFARQGLSCHDTLSQAVLSEGRIVP